MKFITIIIFLSIYIVVTNFFKVIDHITDAIVNKTYKNKKGISTFNGKSLLFSLLNSKNDNVSADVFDECAIKWGLSRDFLVFKSLMSQGTNKDKQKLDSWEAVFNGQGLDNNSESDVSFEEHK